MKEQKQKRIKRVFKNAAEVIQVFAKQDRYEGISYYTSRRDGSRDNPSCYFHGKELYSFGSHYLLARLDVDLNGRKVALVNFTRYSSKTTDQSYNAKKSLTEAGFLVVEYSENSDSMTLSRRDVSDKTLVDIAIQSLENLSVDYAEKLVSMTYRPYHSWYIADIRKDIIEHNKLVSKLGLKHLLVEYSDDIFLTAKRVYKVDTDAKECHAKREQSYMFSESRGYSYREQKRTHRKTA